MQPDWIAVAAIAQVGTVIAIPVSIWLFHRQQAADRRSERDEWERFYAILDDQYLEILRIVVEKPYLHDEHQPRIGLQPIEYRAFAFIVWNFIESIYDYCRRDRRLEEAWHKVLELEASKHAKWFNDPNNRRGFKKRFCDYIDECGYAKSQLSDDTSERP